MTRIQADMLANALAMIASIIADEFHTEPHVHDPVFQHQVATECRKAFRAQLSSLKLITRNPRQHQGAIGASERRTKPSN